MSEQLVNTGMSTGAKHEGHIAHGGEQPGVQPTQQQPAGHEQLVDAGSEPSNADTSGTSTVGSSSDSAGSAAMPPVADQRTAEPIAEPTVAVEAEEDEDRHNFALTKDGAKVQLYLLLCLLKHRKHVHRPLTNPIQLPLLRRRAWMATCS